MSGNQKTKILLLGGGHTHAVLLRDASAHFFTDFDVTVVSEQSITPYSAMFTGSLAGIYQRSETEINIQALCEKKNAHFYSGTVRGIDFKAQTVKIFSGEHHSAAANHLGKWKDQIQSPQLSLKFDLVSLNFGGTVDCSFEGHELTHAIKPFGKYLDAIEAIEQSAERVLAGGMARGLAMDSTENFTPVHFVQIGGGASGCECAAALVARFARRKSEKRATGNINAKITVIESSGRLVGEAPVSIGRGFHKLFNETRVDVILNERVVSVSLLAENSLQLILSSGRKLKAEFVSLSAGFKIPDWLKNLNLKKSESGFLAVNEKLQTSVPVAFACGDLAERQNQKWSKSGVYAIRQAPVLEANLTIMARSLSRNREHNSEREFSSVDLCRFQPQKSWLSLLNDGRGKAFGYKGKIVLPHSRALFWLKKMIDQRFISSFSR